MRETQKGRTAKIAAQTLLFPHLCVNNHLNNQQDSSKD